MLDLSQRSVQLFSLPHRVYAAGDGVFPQWRIIVVAINLSGEAVTLTRVTQFRHYATGTVRKTATGDRIGRIIQGTREVAPDQVVVLWVQEGVACKPPPHLIEFEFAFARRSETEVLRHCVPLEVVPTEYLRFPLRGEWVVANGRPREHSLGRQFGFDFVAKADWHFGLHPPRRDPSPAECASFGQPLFAPVRGVVTACAGDEEDIAPTPGRASGSGVGNHVVIRAAADRFVFMAHLRRGSLRVQEGERVEEGQQLGEVGNSGTTSQPHLHIERLDSAPNIAQAGGPDFAASGLPFGFRGMRCVRKGRVVEGEAIVPRAMDVLS